MKRLKLLSLSLVCLSVAAFATADDKPDTKKALEKLQGKWYLTSASRDEEARVSPAWMDSPDLEVTIKDNEMRSKLFVTHNTFFRIGDVSPEFPSRRPVLKTIVNTEIKGIETPLVFRLNATDLKHFDVEEDDKKFTPGIYSLDGEVLKIALAAKRERPKDFVVGKDKFVATLSRKKPEGKGNEKSIKQDMERLKGAWLVESGMYDLEKLSEKDLKDFRLTFGDEGVKWEEAGKTESLTIQIDPDVKPAAIDLTWTGADKKPRRIRGVYQFDKEKDRLLLQLPAYFSAPRLTEIITNPQGVAAVLVLKRAKP